MELEQDALILLDEAIRRFKDVSDRHGFEHRCKTSYKKAFLISFRFFRKHMLGEMDDNETRDLDSHKIAALIMLSILDSKPMIHDRRPVKAKLSWLPNEIVAYIAMKKIILDYQISDQTEDERMIDELHASIVEINLPEKIYEHKETISSFVDLLARLSLVYADKSHHRHRLRVFMMPLAFIIFFIDSHSRPYVVELANQLQRLKA
jgi:hypothetical protein